ncbi:MAG: hypothetical protein V4539_17060 [Bacteroidota bacterium]
MRSILLLCAGLFAYLYVNAQGSYSVSASIDKQFYCSSSGTIKVYGRAQSFNANTFKGIKYHFYYYDNFTSTYQEIGYYMVQYSGNTPFTTFGNIQPAYFNGAAIGNPQQIPQGSQILWVTIDVPYSAFPNNNTGQQLAVDIEAIDQVGSTTVHSSKTAYNVPLLYTNPVTLSSAPINASAITICGTDNVQVYGQPNWTGYGFRYDWYKDGAVFQLSDNTGIINTSSAGSYYAIVSDACQTATSNTIVITSGAPPPAPTLSSSAGTFLCNGATTTLTATSTGGTIYWNTGATGNSITVSAAGDYYAWEINGCGQSANSSVVSVTTGGTPAAPFVSISGSTLLCNGASVTLSASGTDAITWNTGGTGSSITVSAAGSYYATASNGCGSSGNSNTIVLTTGSSPAAPSISSSNGSLLCNGASTMLSASGIDGSVTWNTGQTGSSISVSNAGSYYANQTNACGTSGNSNAISIGTGSTPAAPSISSSNGTQLCNGSSTTLTASGIVGTVTWNTGQTGNSITVSSAGSYYAYQSNSCGTSGNSNSIIITIGGTPAAPSVSSSNGTFLCNGSSTVLSAVPSGGGTVQWSTGQTGNTITVTAPGNYYAWEQNSCGNSSNSNTITITTGSVPAAPTVTPGNNQLLCNGASTTLTSSGSNVSWSTGAAGNNLTVSTSGTYYAVDHNACGNSSPSNQVVITTGSCPLPSPGTSYTICPGTYKTLDAGAGFDSYLWSNGATTQTISVGPGNYSVMVTKQGCTANSGSVTVNYFTVTAPVISASGSTTFCAGNSIVLSSTPAAAYLWNTGATGSSINVSTAGNFNVTATDNNGCQSTSNTITTFVNALPGASIAGSTSVCQNGASPSVTFSGSAGTAPYTFSYRINGGSVQTVTTSGGNSVSVSVPTGSAGIFTYSLVSVSESSSTGCSGSASGSATVVVNPLPSASISGNNIVCQNSAAPSITLTGANGMAPYTFVYRINGGAAQTVATTSGNSVAVSVPTGSSGVYTFSLVSVSDASNTACSNTASGSASITVNPLPGATISGTTSVCQNSASPFIMFTGSNGTAPYTFTYSINGGTAQTVSTSSGNSIGVNVPTTTAGVFTYTLLSVRDASSTSCSATVNGSATITINALPTASISGTTAVCQNSASPSISFTGSGGIAPYTFVYKINGGSPVSVTTTTGNTISVPVSSATPGVYTYSLVSVTDGSATSCSNAATGSATITVNALPSASISGTTAVCQNTTSPTITFTGSNGTVPYTFTYRINGGANQTITTISGNSVTLAAPTNVSGSFNYSLISVQDGSSTSCSAAVSGNVTITIYALPDAAVIATSDPHLCNGSSGAIKILNFTSGYTYQWMYNGSPLRVTNTDTIINNQAGSFKAQAISAQGCKASAVSNEVQITIGTVPTPVILGYKKVCEGGQTQLVATNATQPFEVWRWTDPPEVNPIRKIYGTDSSFFAAAGQYQVWVMREGCFDSVRVAITADDTEYPAGRLTSDTTVTAYGGIIQFKAEVTGASSYVWDFGDGNKAITSTPEISQRYYKVGDSIPVGVDAISARNCITHFSTWIKVLPEDALPKRDEFVTGNLKDWNVFPVPFHDHLKVSVILERKQDVAIQLFTGEGKLIRAWTKHGEKGENLFTLDGVETLNTRVMYFITAIYNGGKHFDKIYKY